MEIFDAEVRSPPEAFSRGVAVVYLLGSGLPAKPGWHFELLASVWWRTGTKTHQLLCTKVDPLRQSAGQAKDGAAKANQKDKNFSFKSKERAHNANTRKDEHVRYMHTCRAMASAVSGWSPVTITTYKGRRVRTTKAGGGGAQQHKKRVTFCDMR